MVLCEIIHVLDLIFPRALSPDSFMDIRYGSRLGVKADLARRMSRPLAALGGHNQSRHLHPLSVNHVEECACKCVIILIASSVTGAYGIPARPPITGVMWSHRRLRGGGESSGYGWEGC